LTVISVTNCPVALVPAPPAVKVIAPADVIVPARVPAEPEAVEVWLERALTAPTLGAAVTKASPAVNEFEKVNEAPSVV
jgi:hypothetical protein